MEKRALRAYLLCGLYVAAALGAYRLVVGPRQESARAAAAGYRTIDVDSRSVLGPAPSFFGSPKSPFTVVEFGDYQCPPCRAQNAAVLAFVARQGGKVRLTFRNLPLVNIHPYALAAALVAEVARSRGAFWKAHDCLMSAKLSSTSIDGCSAPIGVGGTQREAERRDAADRIRVDRGMAARLGVPGTPTFLLCDAQGTVRMFDGFGPLEAYLQGSGS